MGAGYVSILTPHSARQCGPLPTTPAQWKYFGLDSSLPVMCGAVAGVYHPPPSTKSSHSERELIDYLQLCIDNLVSDTSRIVIAGDFNQVDNNVICTDLGLTNYVNRPTHLGHKLHRIYASNPLPHTVHILDSAINTKHKAVLATPNQITIKNKVQRTFRSHSASAVAQFLNFLNHYSWAAVLNDCEPASAFETFYKIATWLLNAFFPEKTLSQNPTLPAAFDPHLNSLLKKRNRLLTKGRVDDANVITQQVGKILAAFNRKFVYPERIMDTADLWRSVNVITGKGAKDRNNCSALPPAIFSAGALNTHYSNISADPLYLSPPPPKPGPSQANKLNYISVDEMYLLLVRVKKTASGPDNLPHWFFKNAAIHLAAPLAHLFNLSIHQAYVPSQWKKATIIPIPKVKPVTTPSDLRPISLTPILSRLIEKLIVKLFITPIFKQPEFHTQFAFKQTGSTNAALIAILHFVTSQLERVPYVRCFALDFSKAFDRVSHRPLFSKLAQTDLPTNIYNWLREFFVGRSHTTLFQNVTSPPLPITASVVQGSALRPAMFVLNGIDLKPISPLNYMPAYADDTQLDIYLYPLTTRAALTPEFSSILQNGPQTTISL